MFRKSTTDLISVFLTGYSNSFITFKRLLIASCLLSITTLAQSGEGWSTGMGPMFPSPGAACANYAANYVSNGYSTYGPYRLVQKTERVFDCQVKISSWGSTEPNWWHIFNIYTTDTVTYVVSGDENKGSCSGVEGNPCDVVTGRKTETFTDFASNTLQFSRSYNSQSIDDGSRLGGYWRHSFELRLNRFSKITNSAGPATYRSVQNKNQSTEYLTEQDACTSGWAEVKATYRRGSLQGFAAVWENNQCLIKNSSGEVLAYPIVSRGSSDGAAIDGFVAPTIQQVSMPDGATYSFRSIGSGKFVETNREPVSLIIDNGAYVFTSSTNEVYRIEGGLVTSKTLANGITLTISRDEYGVITAVTDPFGQSIAFTYDANTQLTSVTHPGGTIHYGYDENYNLSTVTYEDGSIAPCVRLVVASTTE